MKVYSNVDLVGRSDERISFIHFLPKCQSIKKPIGLLSFLGKLNKDSPGAILIFNPNVFFITSCFIYHFLNKKTKIVFFDILLKQPIGAREMLIAKVKRWLLGSVDCFFSVHKDLSAYEKYYGITDTRSRYIPFKANNYEVRDKYDLRDDGYILSCGVSHRDYNTFFNAVGGLDLKVKVVLPDLKNIKFHKSIVHFDNVPGNVEIIRHDFNKGSWNSILSGAKIVVIPIAEDSIQPSGISVYLESMLFKKAVIISEGPSTKGLIDAGQAFLVERGSASAMRDAIWTLYTDEELRNQYANTGHHYAFALQGVDRLINDMKMELINLQ